MSVRHGNRIGTATKEVVVELLSLDCPAAPAVATDLLKAAGLKPSSKQFKNFVDQVAKHMGPQTDFDGVKACDREAYKNAVKKFLISKGASL